MGFARAKRYDEAWKWASVENRGGGTLEAEIVSCENIPAADSNGTSDPFVRVAFSNIPELAQEAETAVKSNTLNPVWTAKNKFQFFTAQPMDEIALQVYDKNKFGKNVMLCKCKVLVGCKPADFRGKCLGASGEASLFLHSPHAGTDIQLIDGLNKPQVNTRGVPQNFGGMVIRWKYTYSTVGTLFAAVDADPWVPEDYSMSKMGAELGRFATHIYYITIPFMYFSETTLWVRPFETIFWIAFIYTATFIVPNLLSAFLPGILCVSMCRTYWIRQRYGIDGPAEPEVASKGLLQKWKDTEATLHSAQIWCGYLSDLLDSWYEIYQWKKQDTAAILTKVCGVWALLVIFFPWFPAFRYWLFAFFVYMYTLWPLYTYFPNIYRQYSEAALVGVVVSAITNIFNLRNCETYIWPVLPRAIVDKLPTSEAGALQKEVTKDLPHIPQEPMYYDDWRRFHDDYEDRRRLLEVKKRAYESTRPRADTTVFRSSIKDLHEVNGRLEVQVVSATGLVGRDASGLGDPYVVLTSSRGQQEKTQEKKETNRPVWKGELFTFKELNWKSGYLTVAVRDKNVGKDDLSLGTGICDISTLAHDIEEERRIPLGLNGAKGTVILKLRPRLSVAKQVGETPSRAWPTVEQRELLRSEQARRDAVKPMALKQPPDTRSGLLSVTVLDGRALKVCDRNSSDPYVKVRICNTRGCTEKWNGQMGQEQRTKYINSSINPGWNQRLSVFTDATARKFVQVQVMDHDRGGDDKMGDGEVSLERLFENETEVVTVPLKLKGKEEGEIRLMLVATGFGRPDPSPPLPVLQPPPTVQSPRESASPARGLSETPASFTQSTPALQQSPEGAGGLMAQGGSANDGKLRVTVIGARGLVPLPQNSRPEPYVRFRLHSPGDAGGQKFKTRACAPGTTEPVWNVTYPFQGLPADALSTSSLQIEVWDAGSASESLAAGITPLSAVKDHGGTLESWVTVFRHMVQGSSEPSPAGEVRLVLTPEGLDF